MNRILQSPDLKAPTPLAMPSDAAGGEFRLVGLRELIALVRRRARFMTCMVAAGCLLAGLAALVLPRVYTAASMIVLERTETRPYEGITATSTKTLERDRTAAETEMAILTSRRFLARVVDSAGLVADPHYNPNLPPVPPGPEAGPVETARAWLRGRLQEGIAELALQTGWAFLQRPPAELSDDDLRDHAVTTLMGQVKVTRAGESLALSIGVGTWNPELAARLANTIATEYIATSVEVKSDPKGDVSLMEARSTQSFLISLRSEEARLLRERASLAAGFDARHPKVLNADASISTVRTMIRSEIDRLTAEIEQEASKPGARLVSNAIPPAEPSFPKPVLIVGAAGLGSLLMAIALAIAIEGADRRIRNGVRSQQLTGLPNYGYLPEIARRFFGRRPRPLDYLLERPHSAYAEGLRTLYATAGLARPTGAPRSIVITSCLPQEGKSAVAFGLAVTAARDGRRVVLVDLDLRRPGIRAAAGLDAGVPGLEKVLLGEASLADVTTYCPGVKGLDLLTPSGRGAAPVRPASARLKALVADLQADYDLVVIDTPPVLVVDDANWLSPHVGAMLLLVRWGHTEEEMLVDAVEQLRLGDAPLIGTVINRVDPVTHTRHGYGGRPQYYRQARAYMVD